MDHNSNSSSRMIYWVIALGIGIRAFAAVYTYVINPDGMVYIQQAKAIYHGDWMLLRACVPFVSSYPFSIAAVYWIFPSWIDSARLVSVFFGSLTLVPLYFILRRFTNERTTSLCVLVYAFMPFLVGSSADVIRDPLCWFFMVSALLFFIKHLETRGPFWRRFCYLTLSYALFLMAGWARPEAFMALVASGIFSFLYSLFSKDRRHILAAVSSLLLLGLLVTAGLSLFDPTFTGYFTGASNKLIGFVDQYRALRQELGALTDDLRRGVLLSFLTKLKDLIWLIDLGFLIGNSIAGLFYPYIPFFVFGFFGLWVKLKKDPRVAYLVVLFLLGYGLLFFHILQAWYMEHRFLYIVAFPGSMLAALGIEKTTRFIRERVHLEPSIVFILIFLYILGFGLGKNIKKREEDKVVYLHIAEYISNLEKPGPEFIRVLTGDSSSPKLVPFYLNLQLSTGYCPLQVAPDIRDNDALFRYVKENKVKYFLWDDKDWKKTQIDIHSDDFRKTFHYLERWHEKEYGNIILFSRGGGVAGRGPSDAGS
jgi:4-amino-4-deoxy-L-arabinose transferase-like glycosyltransferase